MLVTTLVDRQSYSTPGPVIIVVDCPRGRGGQMTE